MGWIDDNLVLISLIALAILVVVGLTLITVRSISLYRTVRGSTKTVDPHVATLTQSIGQAEGRVAGITANQEELSATIERVSAQTQELGRLVSVASTALAVLRSPIKYFGR